jgi:tetratricopeptide (TPR) repeat protein
MALYAAGNIAVARKFHLSLYNDKEFLSIKAPSISHIKNKLQDFLAEENGILAYLYWKEDKHAEAEKYVEESIKMKESYSAYLLKCNIAFSYRKDHISALESIKKAKDLVIGKDGTWRYNKGFLMMYRGKYGEALKVYNQIINPRNAYEEEINILNQVYEYNEKYAQVIPDKPWPYFIIGFLKCKKEESAEVEGYEFLEKFLKGAKGKPEYKELVDVAQSCVTAIKKDKWD